MKKFLLCLLTAATLCSASKSQTLYNTTWSMYDPADQFVFYFHFSSDTLTFSADNITYTPISTFIVNGSNFTISDVNGLVCPLTDTGHYTFTIINDTLRFTVISDNCASRSTVLNTYYGVAFVTGIETSTVTQSVSLFPNPSPGGVFNLKINDNSELFNKISLTGTEGKIIFEKPFSAPLSSDHIIDLSTEPHGVYFLKLQGPKSNRVFKLVR